MKVILLVDPGHFPVGFQEFFQTYPKAQIEIYHSEYTNLSKFVYGDLIEDICAMYPLIRLYNKDSPENLTCDLYIEYVSGFQLTWSSDNPIPRRIKVPGSLNLRDFAGMDSRAEKGADIMSQLGHFISSNLLPEVPDILKIPDKCDIRSQMKTLREMVTCDSKEWVTRFCHANNLKDDIVIMDKLLRMGADWNRIKSQLRS